MSLSSIPLKKIHEESMSLQNGSWNEMNKKEDSHDQFVSLWKQRTKGLQNEFVSLINTYIPTYINPQTYSGDHTITKSCNSTASSNMKQLKKNTPY